MKLYKYMPMDTLMKFVADPSLRITPYNCQNDPFEFYIPPDKEVELRDIAHTLPDNFRSFMRMHGIVSLSTNGNDPSMWDRYADDHNGGVVELELPDNDWAMLFVDGSEQRNQFYRTHSDCAAGMVEYSDYYQKPVTSTKSRIDEFRKEIYFKKSKAWEHENEFRIILPYSFSNKALINHVGAIILVESMGIKGSYEPFEGFIQPQIFPYLQFKNTHLLEMINKSKGGEFMLFVRLSERCISKVVIGQNVDAKDFSKRVLNETSESTFELIPPYGQSHLLYKASASNEKKTMSFEPLELTMLDVLS